MYQGTAHKELKLFIKESTDEDMIWILHVMNKDQEEYRNNYRLNGTEDYLLQLDIRTLNTINNTDEIKNRISDTYNHLNEREIYNFVSSLKCFRDTLIIRGRNLDEYKKNKRLLYFTLNSISENEYQYNTFKEIKNEYFRLLYTIFMLPRYYDSNRSLDNINAHFSDILSKKPLHFKKFNNDDFYRWAKSYMDQDRENSRVHNSLNYSPINAEEYSLVINAIFDSLLNKDTNIYKAIKDKISNAWHQKIFREKNKGRKHHYYLTDKTLECLEILAEKHNVTKEKIIEKLINDRYAKECMDINDNHLYSLH